MDAENLSGLAELRATFSAVFDPDWYRRRYPDVIASGVDPLVHYLNHGLAEGRDPNAFFDGDWYIRQYPDAASTGLHPLLHYLRHGIARGNRPHPRFDPQYYVEQHPEASANPLAFHLTHGAAQRWPTERARILTEAAGSMTPPDARFRFAIAACARWENDYILEWVAYHRSIGFDHIYLYCNDDDPTGLYEILAPLVTGNEPFVTFIHYPFRGMQKRMYDDFLKRFVCQTEWFIFLDIDEFACLKQHRHIGDFLAEYADRCDVLHLNWLFFGNSGFVERPPGSVLLQYTWREAQVNHYTKMITRTAALDLELALTHGEVGYWHNWGPLLRAQLRRINVLGDDMPDDYYDDFPSNARRYLDQGDRQARILSTAAVYHYAFRSERDIARRIARGTSGDFFGQLAFKKVLDAGDQDKFLKNFSRVQDTSLRDYWQQFLDGGWRASLLPRPPGTNLALGKSATQSSVSQWSREQSPEADAARLVSGALSGLYNNHTGLDEPPWWQVDLGEPCQVRQIRIFNRMGDPGLMRRMSRFALVVSDDGEHWHPVFSKTDDTTFGGIDGHPYILNSDPPTRTRFIRIQLLERGYLHLDQVEIYGNALGADVVPTVKSDEARSRPPANHNGEGTVVRPTSDAPAGDARTAQLIDAYLAGVGSILPRPDGNRCLELGAGDKARPGWISTDLREKGDILALDVAKRFPVNDRSFDFIYSEHMIEHLPFEGGMFMLRECFRVTKPGGVIRIVTPSIDFLISLFAPNRSALHEAYIEWATRAFISQAPIPLPSFVFNNFVRAWGHQFIYDSATLGLALRNAGFTNIKECRINESEHEALRSLENVGRMPAGFLELESMILEATRPAL